MPTGLTEDRYVAALEIREVNDVGSSGTGRETVGGRYVFHHMIWSTRVLGEERRRDPQRARRQHRRGRCTKWAAKPTSSMPKSARLLKAGSSIVSDSVHLHSNGRDTTAHLEIGFKFMPKGYKPEYRRATYALGNGVDIDISGDGGRTSSCTPTPC